MPRQSGDVDPLQAEAAGWPGSPQERGSQAASSWEPPPVCLGPEPNPAGGRPRPGAEPLREEANNEVVLQALLLCHADTEECVHIFKT